MQNINLRDFTLTELKEIAKKMEVCGFSKLTKDKLITEIEKRFKIYQKFKTEKDNKYEILSQLGNKGKEGLTYLVKIKKNPSQDYALKKFKSTKSIDNIQKEAEFQKIASKSLITPKVIDVSSFGRYIVMEKLDESLPDYMRKVNGNLDLSYQKQIEKIINILDKIGIFHADPNPFNFMIKNGKIYIIDFGFAKKIDEKQNGKNPNKNFMILGLLIKLKDLFGDNFSCTYLKNLLDPKQKSILDL